MQISFRLFNPATDAPAFVDFYNDTFSPLRPLYSWPLTVERLLDRVTGNWEYCPDGFLLAFAGEQLVGAMLVGTRLLALTEADRAQVESPVAYISFIAVAPEFRRRGIGRMLHDAAEAFAARTRPNWMAPFHMERATDRTSR
jgi:ribosomal protein S18 acetylase RimI-like enzyme